MVLVKWWMGLAMLDDEDIVSVASCDEKANLGE